MKNVAADVWIVDYQRNHASIVRNGIDVVNAPFQNWRKKNELPILLAGIVFVSNSL